MAAIADDSSSAARPRGLLVDFGGVLTTPIDEAFAALDDVLGLAHGSALRLIAQEEAVRTAFVAHEEGELATGGFERVYAAGLERIAGRHVPAAGLLRRVGEGVRLVPEMLDLVAAVRRSGVPVALVSNSLGDGGYDAVDLAATFDAVVISSEVGTRKPSREIYRIACDRLGLAPGECVLVDDIRQNLDGAARLGIIGVLHRDTAGTTAEVRTLFATDHIHDGPSAASQGD